MRRVHLQPSSSHQSPQHLSARSIRAILASMTTLAVIYILLFVSPEFLRRMRVFVDYDLFIVLVILSTGSLLSLVVHPPRRGYLLAVAGVLLLVLHALSILNVSAIALIFGPLLLLEVSLTLSDLWWYKASR